MGLGKLIKSVFGGKGDTASSVSEEPAETIEYKGFTIEAQPINEGGQFRTAGYISGEENGEMLRIPFIRADSSSDKQSSVDHSISKAKQIIDEQGPGLLKRNNL